MSRLSLGAVPLFLCLPFLFLDSQERNSEGKLSNSSVASSEAQTRKILREIHNLGNHEWAGQYYYGDGLGVNVELTLAPQGGFVFTWHGCLGLYDLNYGDVAFTQGTVKLLFKYPNDREKGFQGIAPEFVPVHWGQRHYLIPADGMIQFTNAINSGMQPGALGGRSWRLLLRRGDEQKKAEGLPDIPSEYLKYILQEPVTAQVSSITETRMENERRVTRVTLNVGARMD